MKKITLAAALLASFVGSVAIAQTAEPTAPMMPFGHGMGGPMAAVSFAELDADASGGVTLEELAAGPAARFAAADTNSDGALSADEVQAAMVRQMAEQMVARLDANGDGLIQAEEMQPAGGMGMDRMFDMADADNDGTVTEAEFDAIKAEMQAMRGQGEGRGRGQGHGEGHGRGHGRGWFGFGGN